MLLPLLPLFIIQSFGHLKYDDEDIHNAHQTSGQKNPGTAIKIQIKPIADKNGSCQTHSYLSSQGEIFGIFKDRIFFTQRFPALSLSF